MFKYNSFSTKSIIQIKKTIKSNETHKNTIETYKKPKYKIKSASRS